MKNAFLLTHFDRKFSFPCVNICSQRKSYSVSEHERGEIMTSIGIIRKVDNLGRIVLPKEIRDFFHVGINENVEIMTTSEGILIRKPGYEVRKIECKEN